MIAANDIKKTYKDTDALRGINLSVSRGEIFGLIGPDGAGKTSLMRILCCLMSFDGGTATVAGFDVEKQSGEIKKRLGYMPQRFSLYPDLSVGENIRFFASLFGVERDAYQTRFAELMQFSKLEPFINRRAAALSGGMKQKLALSCTLIHTPEILILDEPTTGVDPISRFEFWEMLRKLARQGVTILVSTPYMDEADKCDRVALIHKGNILAVGTPSEITQEFKHSVLEIEGANLFDLRRDAETLPSVVEVHLYGDRMHIVTSDIFRCQGELQAKLGISLESVRKVAPSIEDTFISLLK
jgi:ABC-2 type transport system ATP-binding protein